MNRPVSLRTAPNLNARRAEVPVLLNSSFTLSAGPHPAQALRCWTEQSSLLCALVLPIRAGSPSRRCKCWRVERVPPLRPALGALTTSRRARSRTWFAFRPCWTRSAAWWPRGRPLAKRRISIKCCETWPSSFRHHQRRLLPRRWSRESIAQIAAANVQGVPSVARLTIRGEVRQAASAARLTVAGGSGATATAGGVYAYRVPAAASRWSWKRGSLSMRWRHASTIRPR